MIEPAPSATAQKFVVGKESSSFKEGRKKKEIQMYLKVTVLFSPKIKNVSLILCQSSEQFQNKLLTKLFRASLLNYIKHSF